jgi:hypothetical protein
LINKTTYALIGTLILLSCNLKRSNDANCRPDGKKIVMEIKNLTFKDSVYSDGSRYNYEGEVYGVISIVPNFDSVFIGLSQADAKDSLFENRFNQLPILPESKLLSTNYIGYHRRIVCGGKQPEWIKLQPNKENLFYVFDIYYESPNKDSIYIELPIKIGESEFEKIFRFNKGSKFYTAQISN